MNKAMFLKVADAIEAETAHDMKIRFNMDSWVDVPYGSKDICGTSACIAGFANLIAEKEIGSFFGKSSYGYMVVRHRDFMSKGMELMGLTEKEAMYLFVSHLEYVNLNRRLVPDALRYMAEKGKVTTWSEAFEYARCVRRTEKEKEKETA